MSELLNVFSKLSEFYHPTLGWEEIENVYLQAEENTANAKRKSSEFLKKTPNKHSRRESTDSSGVEEDEDIQQSTNSNEEKLPFTMDSIIKEAEQDSNLLACLRDVSNTIRDLRTNSSGFDNTSDCWEQVIKVSPRNRYLACIYRLVILGNYNPKSRKSRQLSLAASSVYFLSLTIPGAKGFHVFEEEIINVSLHVFDMVEKMQNPEIVSYISKPDSIETWVNLASFCEDLKLMFRFVHFDEYKEARNKILKKLVDMQCTFYTKGYVNNYAASLHEKHFEILEEVISAHNGDPKETLLKIMQMTLFLHARNSSPKNSLPNEQTNKCEHISDWFIKMIGKFPRIVGEVLKIYIEYLITNPERAWKAEELHKALEYAAKYDAALFTRCNESIVGFLTDAVNADEASIRCRAVDLFSKIVQIESNVDWELFRHQISEIPREVYIIKELIDSISDINNGVKMRAIQAIQLIFSKGSPKAKQIITEAIKFAHFNDSDVRLPKEPKAQEKELRFDKPNLPEPKYTYAGMEVMKESILSLPQKLYNLFDNQNSYHLRRAAIQLLESIVKMNPHIIYNTHFVEATHSLVWEPTILVRKQALLMIDSILETYPNCYPVVFVWCKIIAPMMEDPDAKNIELAMECFKNRVLLNIKSTDKTNRPEHFMPWIIMRVLLDTKSRLYFQNCFHLHLTKQSLSNEVMKTIESHIQASNSFEAWVLLNAICSKVKLKEPDSLIHYFISYQTSEQWTKQLNREIALEVFITCYKDFSYSALNNVFKYLLNSIKNGILATEEISLAINLMTAISNESQMQSESSSCSQESNIPSSDWVTDLFMYLEQKLLDEMDLFPDNRSTYLCYLITYSETSVQIKLRPHKSIINFVIKYALTCVDLPESEYEIANDRIFNNMICVAGRFSLPDHLVALSTCDLYGKILDAIDRPNIVLTILEAISDLCKKHTQLIEGILDKILRKLSSPYMKNRRETFDKFSVLVLQDQLKLRGSMLLTLLSVIVDKNEEMTKIAQAFFQTYLKSKNPALFHKCLIECPFVLNEYPGFEGWDTDSMKVMNSPLKGDDKKQARYKLYKHFMEEIDDANLIMYFSNLKLLAEKTQTDPNIKSPEGVALINDTLHILKYICQKERKQINTTETPVDEASEILETSAGPPESTNPPPTTNKNPKQVNNKRGRRKNVVTMADAMTTLEKSIVFIVTISENTANYDLSIQDSIDDLCKALSMHFPNLIEFAQPAEFWKKYHPSNFTSTPNKKKRHATKDELFTEEISEIVYNEGDESESRRRSNRSQNNTSTTKNDSLANEISETYNSDGESESKRSRRSKNGTAENSENFNSLIEEN